MRVFSVKPGPMSVKRVNLLFLTAFMLSSSCAWANVEKGQEYYNSGQYKLAYQEFHDSALEGDPVAEYRLGYLYEGGLGVAMDLKLASEWYQKSASNGNTDAASAQKRLARQAIDAQVARGFEYYGARQYKEAYQEWYSAALAGSSVAQNNVANFYYNGLGVSVDYAQALSWFRRAADQNNSEAQYSLGVMYQNGIGVQRDAALATGRYGQSARLGNAKAQSAFGYMYETGKGVQQDSALAMIWYRKSAEQGWDEGQSNLGNAYLSGVITTRDYAEALKWLRKSADQDFAAGEYALGTMYEFGKGVTLSVDDATKWYQKAADQGFQPAIDALKLLKDSLNNFG